MAFNRPTRQQILDRILADIDGQLPGSDARLRRSVLNVLAWVLASALHLLYGFIDWMWRQAFVTKCDEDILPWHAWLWSVPRKAATFAEGQVVFAGADTTPIAAGTRLRRPDQVEFETTAEAEIAAGTATVPVRAIAAGAAGNTAAGVVLQLVESIPGILPAQATVDGAALAGGADQETPDSWRARILARKRNPPHGGKKGEWAGWALEASGVTRAWESPAEMGLGTVTVRFMMDDVRADQQGIPQGDPWPDYTGDLAVLAAYLETQRPVTAKEFYVAAPIGVPLDLTISGLNPATATVRAAIEAEIRDLLRREAIPGATILRSHITEAISIAAGEIDHQLVVPADDVVHQVGEIAVMGVITWI